MSNLGKDFSQVLLILIAGPVGVKSNLEKSGNIMHLLLPATALGLSLVIEDKYQGSWQLINSGFVSRVAVEGLKFTVNKDRLDDSGDDSFTSGHTADSFVLATVIQQGYVWQQGVPAYISAIFVVYSRVKSNNFYVEDVLVGAAIDILSGLYFTKPYSGITFSSTANNGHYGLNFSGTF